MFQELFFRPLRPNFGHRRADQTDFDGQSLTADLSNPKKDPDGFDGHRIQD